MKANVGTIDKVVRISVGLILIALTLTEMIGVWGWVGVVALVTGFVSWCPAYRLIGMSSCSTEEKT